MDEIQGCPIETYVAVASHNKTVVAVGDRGQYVYPCSSYEQFGLQAQTFANPIRPTFVADMLLARTEAAPGAPDVTHVHHLRATKRWQFTCPGGVRPCAA
ncbi:MAG: hypothetical protein ACKPKO_10665, partial [Candidatus Fonsibacter sp.]